MAFMSFLSKLFGSKETTRQETTADNVFCIPRPTIGFVNLLNEAGTSLVESDHAQLAPLFASAQVSNDAILKCHVLFLYCVFDDIGQIQGTHLRVRDIIKAAGAYVAVVASDNNPDHCFKAVEPENDWPANIVLVMNRRADKFSMFFSRLFQMMGKGESMLMAWVKLAPQMPANEHPDCPVSALLPEAGHIAFASHG